MGVIQIRAWLSSINEKNCDVHSESFTSSTREGCFRRLRFAVHVLPEAYLPRSEVQKSIEMMNVRCRQIGSRLDNLEALDND